MASTMRALVKSRPEIGLWMEEVPVPEPGINDVLVRILKTGICGTDLHIYSGMPGRSRRSRCRWSWGTSSWGEWSGWASNVTGFQPGDLVSGEGHLVCGRCRNCLAGRRHLCPHTQGVGVNRPGAFADYLCIPMTNVWGASRQIPLDVLACFDPLGNAVHTALSFDVLGEDVLITGAGPIGLMAAAVVRHAGARHVVVTDLNPGRLELARRMGATVAVDPRATPLAEVQKQLRMKEGFDVGLEMSGSEAAFGDLLTNLCHGGRMALLGIPDRADVGELEPDHLQRADDQGNLRSRDVRDLVQDDGDDPERPRHHTRDHAPLSCGSVRGGVRRGPIGAGRQGGIDLE